MPNYAAQVLTKYKEEILDRVVSLIQQRIHSYSRLSTAELRASAEALVDAALTSVDEGQSSSLGAILLERSSTRISEGFSLSEFLGAVFSFFPAARQVVRESGLGSDPAFAPSYDVLESRMQELTFEAANIYAEAMSRQLQAKNHELNILNQRLVAHERIISMEATATLKALNSANEFNSRVIESLSSGLFVVDSKNLQLVLWSGRMSSITGIPSEEALGRNAVEVFERMKGLDGEALVSAVRRDSRLPVTKVKLIRPDGRSVWIYLRAHRMFDENGEPEGTVGLIDDITERELLIHSFSRYVSSDVVRRVLSRGENVVLGGEMKTVTVFFVDIRGFSSLAESLEPERLHALLNEYFRLVIEALTAHNGFIDKFIGDNVMALFARSAIPAQGALDAVAAALAVQSSLSRFNEAQAAMGNPRLEVGIGINTGQVMLGNIGSEERMDFTAIGDAVNVSARLQSLAGASEILVGEETASLIGGRYTVDDRGMQLVKGRSGRVRVFSVKGFS